MRGNLDAPGLKKLKRHNGRIDCYWVADEALVKKGYPTKTVRLHGDPNDPADFIAMADRCRVLQAEMRQWADGHSTGGVRAPAGTVAWLGEMFETDPDSPMNKAKDDGSDALRRDTKLFYSRYIKILTATVGQKQLDKVTGREIRRWHDEWKARGGNRSAYACIQTLRRLISFACEDALRDDDPCLRLSKVLKEMSFETPEGRTKRATYEHVAAFRPVAAAAGRGSIALAVTLQFDLGMRQKDIIGEWIKDGNGSRLGITDGAWRWQIGLDWSHIDADWILRKPTSKSNGKEIAEHDLKLYPDTLALLQAVPKDRRIGPVVLDEHSGKPWRRPTFSREFRKLATKSGWPADVWNMDSRAGAVSEAFEAGAEPADVMKAATHTQISTTMGYNRGGVVQSSRVAELRMARRNAARTDSGNTDGNGA